MWRDMFRFGVVAFFSLLAVAHGQDAAQSLGSFESQGDVGSVLHPGTAEYDAHSKTYTVSGSGENMWFASDEFHFVWKKMSAQDITLAANISILGEDGEAHRKGVLMIRQSLDGDAAYVDAARHGEGLTSLQFRESKGSVTHEIESNVSGPARLRIEKQGDRFYLWIGGENEDLEFAGGSARVEMHAPFYVGIGVCAHRKDAVAKAAFTNVELNTSVIARNRKYSTVETVLQSGDARSAFVSPRHLTSPGWSESGKEVTFDIDGQRQQAPFTPLRTASPVGAPVPAQSGHGSAYSVSNRGGSLQIWRDAAGNEPQQMTSDDFNNIAPHLSPDGKLLLYLSYSKDLEALAENQKVTLRMMSLADQTIKTLATFVGGPASLGTQPWSPDGRRVVFVSYQSMK